MNITSYLECLPREIYDIIWKDVIKSNKINSNNCHLWEEFLTEELIDYVYKTGVIHQINEFRNLGIAHFVSVKKFCDKQQKTNSGININNFVVPLYKTSHYPSLVSNKEHYHLFRNRNYDYLYMLYSLVFNQHQCPGQLWSCYWAIKFYEEDDHRTNCFSYIINPNIIKTKLQLFNLFRIMFVYRNTA